MTKLNSALMKSALMAMLASGCDPTPGKDVDSGAPTEPVTAECDVAFCVVDLVVDSQDLQATYAYDPVTGWPPGTPQEVLDDCNPPPVSGDCVLELDPLSNVTGETTAACVCIPFEDGMDDPGTECCSYNVTCDNQITDALDLGYPGSYHCDSECTGAREWVTDETCDDIDTGFTTPGYPIAAAANFKLDVDHGESFIYILTPDDSQTFFVTGGGSLSTVTDEFLTATLYADDGELGQYEWTSWWFWTDTPIDFNEGAGTFTIPATTGMAFDGAGYQDTTPKLLEIDGMTEDASGHIYPSTHTWEADFTQTSFGWTVTIHLEGTYEDL